MGEIEKYVGPAVTAFCAAFALFSIIAVIIIVYPQETENNGERARNSGKGSRGIPEKEPILAATNIIADFS